MSSKGHITEYAILVALLLAFAGVVALLAVRYGGDAWGEDDRSIRTTYSSEAGGTMALAMLAKRLGMPFRRNEQVLFGDVLAGMDVLLLIDPIKSFAHGEVAEIRQWVRQGGVLICTDGIAHLVAQKSLMPSSSASDSSDDDANEESAPLRRGANTWGRSSWDAGEHRWTAVDRDNSRLSVSYDINSLCFQTADLVFAKNDLPASARPLLADKDGLRVIELPLGQGRLIVMSDSSMLANAWIGEADNSVATVNMLAYAAWAGRGPRAAYDEFHFGYTGQQGPLGVLRGMLIGTPAGWAVLTLIGAAALWMALKGRRFGTRRGRQRTRRRSKLEYLHAIGATYRSARANRLTLRLLWTWFRQRAAETSRVGEAASAKVLASRLAQRTGGSAQKYESIFQQCQQAQEQEYLSRSAMTALLRQLKDVEAEMSRGAGVPTKLN